MANPFPDVSVVNYKGSGNVSVWRLQGGTVLDPEQDGNDVLAGNLEAPSDTLENNHGNRIIEAFGKRFLLHGFRVYAKDEATQNWPEVTGLGLSINDPAHSGLHVLYPGGVKTLAFLCEPGDSLLHVVSTTDGVNWTNTTTALNTATINRTGVSIVFRDSIFWWARGTDSTDIRSYDFVLESTDEYDPPNMGSNSLGANNHSFLVHQGELFVGGSEVLSTDGSAIWRLDGTTFTKLDFGNATAVNPGSVYGLWSDGDDIIMVWQGPSGDSNRHARRVSDVLLGGSFSVSGNLASTILANCDTTGDASYIPFTVVDPDPSISALRIYFWQRNGNFNAGTFNLFRVEYRRIDTDAHTGAFALGEIVTGGTSGAIGVVTDIVDGVSLSMTNVVGVFQNLEALTGSIVGVTSSTSTLDEQAATAMGIGILGSNYGLPHVTDGGLDRIPASPNPRPSWAGLPREVFNNRTRYLFNLYGDLGVNIDLAMAFSPNSEAPDIPMPLAASTISLVDVPVTTGLVGNLGEVALEALSPATGDAYVVTAVDGDGTLNPGGIGIAVGDMVEFDGANWTYLSSFFDSLEGYWKFNNDGLDSSVNSLDLTFTGTEAYDTGIFGNGYDLPGVDTNYADRSIDDPSLRLTGGVPFGIQAWVDATTLLGKTRAVVDKSGGFGNSWSLAVDTDGTVVFPHSPTISTAAGLITTSAGLQHILVTGDGSTIKIYVDGVEGASEAQVAWTDNAKVLRIGDREANDFPWDGVIDEVAIWSRWITPAEVALLYNAGAGRELDTGFPAFTTHATLSSTTPLVAPYTDGVDDSKIAAFDGTSLTGIVIDVPTNNATTILGITPSNGASTWSVDAESGAAGIAGGDRITVILDIA